MVDYFCKGLYIVLHLSLKITVKKQFSSIFSSNLHVLFCDIYLKVVFLFLSGFKSMFIIFCILSVYILGHLDGWASLQFVTFATPASSKDFLQINVLFLHITLISLWLSFIFLLRILKNFFVFQSLNNLLLLGWYFSILKKSVNNYTITSIYLQYDGEALNWI